MRDEVQKEGRSSVVQAVMNSRSSSLGFRGLELGPSRRYYQQAGCFCEAEGGTGISLSELESRAGVLRYILLLGCGGIAVE